MEFGFKLPELGVVAGFHAQDGTAQDQQLAHDGDGAIGDFSQRRNPEQAHDGDEHAGAEAGHCDDALQFGEFYALFLGHRAKALLRVAVSFLSITDEESEYERIISGTLEAAHALGTGKHSVLDVSQRVSVHRRVVLIGATEERDIRVHIRREVFHIRLPGLVPVRVRSAGELHVQEYPVLEDDAEGIGTPVEIPGLLSHIDSGPGALDGISGLVLLCVQRLDEDGNLTLVIEIGELLQTNRILVLDPGLNGGAAVIIPRVGGVNIAVLERQDNTCNSAAVYRKIRDVDFKNVCGLVSGIRWVVTEFGVQNDIVRGLIVLELDGACTKVISGRVEHSRISKGCRGRRPPWVSHNSRHDGRR